MLGNRNGLIFVYVCASEHMSVSVCVSASMVCVSGVCTIICMLMEAKSQHQVSSSIICLLVLVLRRSLP